MSLGDDDRALQEVARASHTSDVIGAGLRARPVSVPARCPCRRPAAALGPPSVAGGALLFAAPRGRPRTGSPSARDLPIPRWLFAWGAAVVLVVSFVGLAVLWPQAAAGARAASAALLRVPRVLEVLCGALGVAVVRARASTPGSPASQTGDGEPRCRRCLRRLLGRRSRSRRCCSATCSRRSTRGAPWPRRGLGWPARVGGALPAPLAYPAWLGRWPAAFGILAFAWLELVYTEPRRPAQLAIARAGLRGDPARRHEPLRDRAVDAQRRRVRRRLRPLRAARAAALGPARAVPAPAAGRRRRDRRRSPAPSRCCA